MVLPEIVAVLGAAIESNRMPVAPSVVSMIELPVTLTLDERSDREPEARAVGRTELNFVGGDIHLGRTDGDHVQGRVGSALAGEDVVRYRRPS